MPTLSEWILLAALIPVVVVFVWHVYKALGEAEKQRDVDRIMIAADERMRRRQEILDALKEFHRGEEDSGG